MGLADPVWTGKAFLLVLHLSRCVYCSAGPRKQDGACQQCV